MLTTFNPELEDKETPVYEKYDPLLHGATRKAHDQILSVEFMKKYISVVKCIKPKLTEQACELISNEYSRLRSQDSVDSDVARTQPVTARTLETLIRLSTAHAKARMAKNVGAQDARAAIELVQFAYFKKVLEKEKKQKRKRSENADEESDVSDDDSSRHTTQSTSRAPKKSKVVHYDTDDEEQEAEEAISTMQTDSNDITSRESITVPRQVSLPSTSSSSKAPPEVISDERLIVFKNGLQKIFRESRESSLPVERIVNYINQNSGDVSLSQAEISSALERMTNDNQIMVADEIVFLI